MQSLAVTVAERKAIDLRRAAAAVIPRWNWTRWRWLPAPLPDSAPGGRPGGTFRPDTSSALLKYCNGYSHREIAGFLLHYAGGGVPGDPPGQKRLTQALEEGEDAL